MDRVNVGWDAVPGATHYRVYRNDRPLTQTATALGSWQTGTTFDDTSAPVGAVSYYWVRAALGSRGEAAGLYSPYDTGYPRNDPPAIVSAISSRSHGSAGTLSIDVSSPSAVECRVGGPTVVVVEFTKEIQAVGGPSQDDVTLSSGAVDKLTIDGTTLTIEMSGVADKSTLAIGFPGIESLTGAGVTDTLSFGVLAGDVNASGLVDNSDLIAVRVLHRQEATEANCGHDVNCTGVINYTDMMVVRVRRGNQLPK